MQTQTFPGGAKLTDVYLGRYQAVKPLGRGSMGRVILARRLETGEQVVIKVMHDHIVNQPRFQQLFEREAQSMARLRHPYAVRLVDAGFTPNQGPCLVMEYVQGVPVDALLRIEKKLPLGRVGLMLGMLCRALEAANRVNLVHRDLKPSNLMAVAAGTPDESIRVMDFGLAQLTTRPHISAERLAGAEVNLAMGTPAYVAPEQLRGDEMDGRADLYSVGVMLFEMLTGYPPFPHKETQQLLHAHVFEKPLRFATVGARQLPAAIEQVVQLCMEKYPNERPQSARELADRFGKALGIDIWEAAQPDGWDDNAPPEPPPSAAPLPAWVPPKDPHAVVQHLEAWMPERIAVIKLRGFLEDFGGKVLVSEPGLLRVQVGEVKQDSLLVRWGWKKRRADPIEIEFQLDKPDPKVNRLRVKVTFRPLGSQLPRTPQQWRATCEALFDEMRAYLLALS